MSAKVKAPVREAARSHRATPAAVSAGRKAKAPIPPDEVPALGTLAWRLGCIAALGKQVQEYVEFMGKVGDLKSSSAEAREKAVVAFHQRLAALEQQLGRIHDELQLG